MDDADAFDALLGHLGVDACGPLPDQAARLDEQGHLQLDELLAPDELPALRQAFDAAVLASADRPGARQTGTRHAPDLLAVSEAFDGVPGHPRLLGLVRHLLGRPFALLQCSGRDPLPGHGAQGLHADWLPLLAGEPAAVVTALVRLDPFTADNGATRLVPGSQRLTGPIPPRLRAPDARHPDERRATGPAGSALVFHGHLWHAGAANASQERRRTLQLQWVARDRRPPHQPGPDLPARLSAEVRAVLGG